MFSMFRRLFSRKRQCPECGFQGSSRDFKRVKNTPKVSDARDAKDYGTEADKKAFGVGQTGATGGNVGTGNVGASGSSATKPQASHNTPKISDARDAADYGSTAHGSTSTGSTGSTGAKSK